MDIYHLYKRKVLTISVAVCIVVSVFLSVMRIDGAFWGFLAGSIISLLNFGLLAAQVGTGRHATQRGYASYLIANYLLRYGMIGVAMFYTMKLGGHPLALICGIFVVQGVLFLDNLVLHRCI